MDNKKKPPPGATLISRLREGRIKREQALADRKAQAAETTAAETKASEAKTAEPRPVEAKAAGKAKAAREIESKPAIEALVVEAEVIEPRPSAKAPPEKKKEAVEDFTPRTAAPARAGSGTGSLIRRTITIDDLRPVNDDYELLTEEIRLAGRFAAAGLIAQGLRLLRLKEAEVYKQHYETFEDYCRKEHNMSATYAYRLIRMSEMAEKLALEGTKHIGSYTDAMPDPFEVMLGLGHRHLLALLPLEMETAQELLVKGVPLADEKGKSADRIPISQATEQQIRQYLRLLLPPTAEPGQKKKPSLVPASRSVRTLREIVELMQDWAEWLESEPDPRHYADRVGEGREKSRLAQKLRALSERIVEAL